MHRSVLLSLRVLRGKSGRRFVTRSACVHGMQQSRAFSTPAPAASDKPRFKLATESIAMLHVRVKALRQSPPNHQTETTLAIALHRLGSHYFEKGDEVSALDALDEAVELYMTKLLPEGIVASPKEGETFEPPAKRPPQTCIDGARCFYEAGIVALKSGHPERAAGVFEGALNIAKRTFGYKHKNVAEVLVCQSTLMYSQNDQHCLAKYVEAARLFLDLEENVRALETLRDYVAVLGRFHQEKTGRSMQTWVKFNQLSFLPQKEYEHLLAHTTDEVEKKSLEKMWAQVLENRQRDVSEGDLVKNIEAVLNDSQREVSEFEEQWNKSKAKKKDPLKTSLSDLSVSKPAAKDKATKKQPKKKFKRINTSMEKLVELSRKQAEINKEKKRNAPPVPEPEKRVLTKEEHQREVDAFHDDVAETLLRDFYGTRKG